MKNAEFDSWLASLFFRTVQSLGVLAAGDDWEERDRLRERAGIIDKYSRWWNECMEIFAANGYLDRDGARVRVSPRAAGRADESHAGRLGERLAEVQKSSNMGEWSAALALVEPCIENLPNVLRGKMLFTDILFADSSLDKAENLYQRNEQCDFFNGIVANVAKACVQKRGAGAGERRSRIIEIGAGTGGTTAMVLPALAPLAHAIEEYCFTDISRVFLQHGDDQYRAKYPFFRSALWNIEKPLRTQGIEPGAYDIAIATNVLHATRDIRQTLRKAKAALEPDGILIINELVEKTTLATLIFGLIDGWWLFEDNDVRIPGSPLLNRARWTTLLEEEGFSSVLIPEVPVEGMPQQVFVAQSDGIVRREVDAAAALVGGRVRQRHASRVDARHLTPSASIGKLRPHTAKPDASEARGGDFPGFVRDVVVDALSNGLRVPKSSIESDIPFADYGVDSILGVAFVNQIKARLAIELNTAVIFDYTNVDQLVRFIVENHREQIAAARQRGAPAPNAATSSAPAARKVVKSAPRRGRTLPGESTATLVGSDGSRGMPNATDIAVIGMSGQFPGASDVDELWENLARGKDGVDELPASYLDQHEYFSPVVGEEGKTYCKWGGILADRDCFDPLFFNISPREAESMHPHQRLILQESWKSLEDAGYDPKRFSTRKVGVFIGAEPISYQAASFTGSSEAIIASRLSYFLNLKGPAYVVNTGCSSSAVAIHLACESLRREECSLALAGGAYAAMQARALVTLSAIEMLAIGGRCRTFDAECDGTAMSEGVGVVVLKRLQAAVADGDSIYGVIKGSGVNQDGASNGITAPNGLAQEQLITQVYRDYGIDPAEITYVEAHGTGTPLGDPVEANALVRAFGQFTTKTSYCVLGSAKASVGHTAAAAGVVGLIKVLLSLKHRQLPGLLHFKRLNPLIELEGSAFTIRTQTTAWQAERGKPLVAALNSFGHSGTNVHLVVAEHVDERDGEARDVAAPGPVLVPLSAKTEERLQAYAEKLLLFLERASAAATTDAALLGNLAYTLQVGREAMSERTIFLVETVDELKVALRAFIQGKEGKGIWRGTGAVKGSPLAAMDDDIRSVVAKWFAHRKYDKLAELWVSGGCPVDWQQSYGDSRPRRISLPTYPFAKERYWIESAAAVQPAAPGTAQLHPLIHRNDSGVFETKFVSELTGDEFFLQDHRVAGRVMLPAVAHVEMASAAIRQAYGLSPTIDTRGTDRAVALELRDVVWSQAVVASGTRLSIRIRVIPLSDTEAEFEIYEDAESADGEETLFSQGHARLLADEQPEAIDLAQLRTRSTEHSLSGEKIYAALESAGTQYGSGYRTVARLEEDASGSQRPQILATLQMPRTPGEFGLHPGMLDGALQAVRATLLKQDASTGTPPPRAVDSITVYRRLPEKVYALGRLSEGTDLDATLRKVDITLCDEQGLVCVRMEGLSMPATASMQAREGTSPSRVSDDIASCVPESDEQSQRLLFEEYWEEQECPADEGSTSSRLVILADPECLQQLRHDMPNQLPDAILVSQADAYGRLEPQVYTCRSNNAADIESLLGALGSSGASPITLIYMWSKGRGEEGVHALFGLFRAVKRAAGAVARVVLAGHYDPSNLNTCWDYSWIGLQRSLQLLLPDVQVGVLYSSAWPCTTAQLLSEARNGGVAWYRDDRRCVLSIRPLELGAETREVSIRPHAGYLITGGAGGLGLEFAHDLASAYRAKLVLLGRSPLTPELQERLDALKRAGAEEVHYYAVDVGDQAALSRWARELPFSLSGIIHAAGVSSTQPFFDKSAADISEVLRPKCLGTVLIDEVLGDQPLDFVCYFSSASALLGDFGSCDYAVANRFQMGYAAYRERAGLHNGRTVVVNWPFWRSRGMNFGDVAQAEFYLKSSGQLALEVDSGLNVWHAIMRAGPRQALVMLGKPARIEQFLMRKYRSRAQQRVAVAVPQTASAGKGWQAQYRDYSLRQCVLSDLRQQTSTILKIPTARLDDTTNLADYGFDSISLTEFAKQLSRHFSLEITPAVFFNAGTVARLAEHLLQEHAAPIAAFYRRPQTEEVRDSGPVVGPSQTTRLPRSRSARRRAADKVTSPGRESIAIVGMSGRFPGASSVDQLWTLLAEGRSGIGEIPRSRWDWRDYFIAPRDPANRITTNLGGFIDGVDEFDALFFEVSPREAEEMDPSERLLLMESYRAIEDAGISPGALRGKKIGVFVGMEEGQYGSIAGRQGVTTNGNAMVSSRLSYFLDLHGPTLAINTACSSGLVALHQAITSLRQGECRAALVAGVSLTLVPEGYVLMSEAGMLSDDGHCSAFAKNAGGIGAGEAVVVLVVKRLADAVADGDRVYGAVKASGINFDGKTNGVTAPNGEMQAELIESIYRQHRIDVDAVTHVIAHGTGTKLGDPVELNALNSAFRKLGSQGGGDADRKPHCAITSCKSNLGHTMAASGLVSVVALLKGMQHGKIPATLRCEEENDYIAWQGSAFYINKQIRDWPRKPGQPRLGAVSAFGRSGTNAHVVIEEGSSPAGATPLADERAPRTSVIVPLSAKTEEQLQQRARDLLAFIREPRQARTDGIDLAAVAYTLQVGREAMDERLSLIASSIDQLAEKLDSFLRGNRDIEETYRGRVKSNKDLLSLFDADGDLQQTLDRWTADRKLSKLAHLWSKGFGVDWDKLHGARRPLRISLPTYPFAKDRYWVTQQSRQLPAGGSREATRGVERANVAGARMERFLTKGWKETPRLSTAGVADSAIIVCSRETQALAERLLERLPESRIVALDSDLSTASATLTGSDGAGWIDVTGCGVALSHDTKWQALLQRYIDAGPAKSIRMLCVTQGLEAWQGTAINLSGADRVGLYRMLSSEYARLRASHVDLDGASDTSTIIEQIVAEFAASKTDGHEVEVCYRHGRRYRAVLEEVRSTADDSTPRAAGHFDGADVLWITGGTRGIGYACAQHFAARHGVRKLVLTGRDRFPPRQAWPSVANESSDIASKIRSILALESQGVEVRVLSVDLTDAAALQASIDAVKSTLGPIGGVLHCAGIADAETPAFIRKSLTAIDAVLAPKVVALDQLQRCFAKEALKFFVLFSSVSAIVPSLAVGQSDYAQANAYMDYFASAHAEQMPIVSIQWPSWKETGMGESRSPAYRRLGFLSHTTAEGLRLLDRILSGRRELGPVVLPAIVDERYWQPAQLLEARPQPVSPPLPMRAAEHAEIPPETEQTARRPRAAINDSLSAIQQWLTTLVAKELKLPPSRIDIATPLPEYGADSILFTQILREISRDVGESLEPSLLFEYPTLEGLSKWLEARYGESLAAARHAARRTSDAPDRAAAPAVEVPAAHVQPVPVEPVRRQAADDIAVVGMSCRFPGASTVDELWQLLSEGRSAIRRVPRERWGYSTDDHAAVLDDANCFDPAFFAISQGDARAMDPQALLVLEESLALWHQAGYTLDEIKGREIGVYLGARSQSTRDMQVLNEAQNLIMAIGANYLAANISRLFDLRGPSVVIDTACSSALVAMNMAIQSLHAGEIESAVVGGVSLLSSDWAVRTFERRGILNRAHAFHLFDGRASGVILGEGAGMVWLKTLDRALRDGDSIYGVIKAVAINNDGRTAGPAAPNIHAQKAVMTRALERSGKQPADVTYVEANGSGTEVTDLLELKAIEAVYRSASREPCELGSMKPNIGHPLCAEGIASFIKAILLLHRGRRVPFLSAQEPMQHYDLASSPFFFSRQSGASDIGHRTIAINCFADGGTNAHVIVDAWQEERPASSVRRPIEMPRLQKIDCSARSSQARIAVASVLENADADCEATSFWRMEEPAASANEPTEASFWGLDGERAREAGA